MFLPWLLFYRKMSLLQPIFLILVLKLNQCIWLWPLVAYSVVVCLCWILKSQGLIDVYGQPFSFLSLEIKGLMRMVERRDVSLAWVLTVRNDQDEISWKDGDIRGARLGLSILVFWKQLRLFTYSKADNSVSAVQMNAIDYHIRPSFSLNALVWKIPHHFLVSSNLRFEFEICN